MQNDNAVFAKFREYMHREYIMTDNDLTPTSNSDATDIQKLIHFLKRLDKFDFVGGVQGEVRKEAQRLLKELGKS